MIVSRSFALSLSVAVLGLSLALPASAQEGPASAEPATIELRLVIPPNLDVPPQFVATVRDADGNAIPGIAVDFSRELEFLGTKRTALLGAGTTDVGGIARLVVLPRQEQATVIASVTGSDVTASIEATFPEDRVDTFFDPGHEHGLLTPLREVMPSVIAAVVVLLWIFIIGLVVTSVRRIRRLGHRKEAQVAQAEFREREVTK
ncbi:MAG TPA: Ig-like domain-containing protein [Acidimicrobiia bacterium]